jgi:N utilization substance protein A
MNNEFFKALKKLEKDRGISSDFMLEKIKKAILTTCKNNYGNEEVLVKIDEKNETFEVFLIKTVSSEVTDENKQISINDAKAINPESTEGEKISILLNTKDFGRIAAQTARNIIRQGIKDGEKDNLAQEFLNKKGQMVTAKVEKIDKKSGAFTLRIGKAETTLPKSEQICNEPAKENDNIKVLIIDVILEDKGPKIMVSRNHPNFIKNLFENEVPEIAEGVVEIKSIAREAGFRTKIAVCSNNPDVDAVGACIGKQGLRLNQVLAEICGEKIDIIEYNEDITKFITSALQPAKIEEVILDTENPNCCQVKVLKNQFSLAIGTKGQNVRLAAKLTGCKIDISEKTF